MPELPEVERGRRIVEAVAVGRRIRKVWCADDPIVFEGVDPANLRRSLTGRKVCEARRWGKVLWWMLDRPPHPQFHFGMTGAFRIRGEQPLPLASGPRVDDPQWPPRFSKIHLIFEDGGELVMTNARRLGRIRLLEDPENEPPVGKLGFDPYLALPEFPEFAAKVARRKISVKALLLDQKFAAGVGNWIADEVLYQARLDPRLRADQLTPEQVRRLRTKLRHVIKTAVEANADKSRFPKTWLFHHRWGKNQDAQTARGEPIEHIEVAGRTTAWVPSAQNEADEPSRCSQAKPAERSEGGTSRPDDHSAVRFRTS